MVDVGIYLDYHRAMRQADQIRDIAKDLNRLSSHDLSETLQELSSSWKGDSATAYLQKGELLSNKIEATARNLDRIATSIEQVAKRILQAEKEAQELARNRTS